MSDLNKELKRVVEFNKLMGREVGNREHLFLQSQLLVQEGITELAEALYKNDRILLRDALADTVVVAMGGFYIAGGIELSVMPTISKEDGVIGSISECLCGIVADKYSRLSLESGFMVVIDHAVGYAGIIGIDIAEDLKAINDSNLSKFCLTVEEAQATVEKYAAMGVKAEYKMTWNEDYPYAVYSTETNGDFTKGKLLKSVNYAEPVFQDSNL